MSRPPFRADHVGSFLRPERLREAREEIRRRRPCGGRTACDRGRVHSRGRAAPRRMSASRGSPTASSAAPISTSTSSSGSRASRPTTASSSQTSARATGPRSASSRRPCMSAARSSGSSPIQGPDFDFLKSATTQHAEGLHSGPLDAAFPRRARSDQRGRLSEARGFLRRSHRRLSRRGRRSRRARLPLPAVRRHQPRLSLRSRHPRPHQGARRRSGRADAALLPGSSTIRSATGRPT